jgi:hypothetical protein
MTQILAGQHQSGTGQVQLECTVETGSKDRLLFENRVVLCGQQMLLLSFRQTSRPMWIHHEAEARVALTLFEVGQILADALKRPIDWRLISGDWLENQAIGTPSGSIMLRRYR